MGALEGRREGNALGRREGNGVTTGYAVGGGLLGNVVGIGAEGNCVGAREGKTVGNDDVGYCVGDFVLGNAVGPGVGGEHSLAHRPVIALLVS